MCDDGGPGSLFDECLYGTDCADCCPRDPYWGYGTRYMGELDERLTRYECTLDLIKINMSSPCLNSIDLSVDSNLGKANMSRESATFFVVVTMIVMSIIVAFIMVPGAVYAQLVYSGFWPVLNWPQRIWSMLVGDYETAVKAPSQKRAHQLYKKASADRLMNSDSKFSKLGSGKKRWFHMSRSWGRYVYPQPDDNDDLVDRTHRRRSSATQRYSRHSRYSQSDNDDSSADDDDRQGLDPCLFGVLVFPFVLFINILTWEVIFDIIPLRWDGLKTRKLVKFVRILVATYVLGILLTYVPQSSTSGLQGTLDCVLTSCQDSGWRRTADELDCESTKAVGLMQPSFWSDLLDVVEAALTLAVLTLVAEWRDTVQGKNEVGKELLEKVDKELKQGIDSALNIPDGPPKVKIEKSKAVWTSIREIELRRLHKLCSLGSPPQESLQLLKDLRDEEVEETPGRRQRKRIEEVNLAGAGVKLTMAQLYAAVGSLIAIRAGATDYSTQCVSNALFWENEALTGMFDVDTPPGAPPGPAAPPSSAPNGLSDALELVLMKPGQEYVTSWAMVCRATLSNLSLITVGIAVKNFITRTAAGKASVKAMLSQRDKEEKDDDLLHILLGVVGSVAKTIKHGCRKVLKMAYNKYDPENKQNHGNKEGPNKDRRPVWLQTVNLSEEEQEQLQEEEMLASNELDEAAKQNARAILKVYKYSTCALIPLVLWYFLSLMYFLFNCFSMMILPFVLLTIVFLTLVPMLDYIADALRRGVDNDDKRRIDASMFVVKTVIVLRSCLILGQSAMLQYLYGYSQAEAMAYDAYWRTGDAAEKIAYVFTLDVSNMFNFDVNILSKLLSLVVLGLELVNQIGSEIKETLSVRLFPRGCCQACVVRCARLLDKRLAIMARFQSEDQQSLAQAKPSTDGNGTIQLETAKLVSTARPQLYAQFRTIKVRNYARPSPYHKILKTLEEHLKDFCQMRRVFMTWDDVEGLLDQIDSLQELQQAMKEVLLAPDDFFGQLAMIDKPVATRLMLARLRRALEEQLSPSGFSEVAKNSDEAKKARDKKWSEEVLAALPVREVSTSSGTQLQWTSTMQVMQEALNSAMEDPEAFMRSLSRAAIDKSQVRFFPVAKQTLIDKLKPKLMPHVRDHGEDTIDPARLEMALDSLGVSSVEEIQAALGDEATVAKIARKLIEMSGQPLPAVERGASEEPKNPAPLQNAPNVTSTSTDGTFLWAPPQNTSLDGAFFGAAPSGRAGSEASIGAKVQGADASVRASGSVSSLRRTGSSTASIGYAPEI